MDVKINILGYGEMDLKWFVVFFFEVLRQKYDHDMKCFCIELVRYAARPVRDRKGSEF